MFLIVDNTEDAKVTFSFWLDNKLIQRTLDTSRDKHLLVCLKKTLSSLKLKLEDIKRLGVVVGAGKFTSSRLGVTAVNALAFSLRLPIVALPKDFDPAAALKLAESAVVGKYVLPAYSGEARIG